jgi:ABC-type Na+ transport system ATPase subunit NatA
MKEQGRLIAEEAWEKCTLFDINIRPQGMSAEDLRAGFHRLTKALYSDEFTDRRRRHFHRGLRRRLAARRPEALAA